MASTIRGSDNFDSAGVGKNATAGGVGTYAWLSYAGNVVAGSTYAGSSLRYAGIVANHYQDSNTAASMTHGTTVSGTWRAMGTVSGTVSDHLYSATAYIRIS